jgi:hypothetical protein
MRNGPSFLARRRFRNSHPFDRGTKKTIATLGKSFDEAWLVRFVVQGQAKLFDSRVEAVVEVHEGILGPETLAKLFPRDHLPWLRQQHSQYPERLLLDLDLVAALVKLARAQV